MRTEAEVRAAYQALGEWRAKHDPHMFDHDAEMFWNVLRFVLGYEYEDQTPQEYIGTQFEDLGEE